MNRSRPNKKTISFRLLLFIARRNLLAKKLRTGLTLAGVVIGIGAIYFLLSFGLGLQSLVTNEIVGNESIKTVDITTPNSEILLLDDNTVNKISNLPNVESIGRSFLLPGIVRYSGSEIDTVVYAVDQTYQEISNLTPTHGRMLVAEDNKSVVLNRAALEAVGLDNSNESLGMVIEVSIPVKTEQGVKQVEEMMTIEGVIESGSGSEVFLPLHVIQEAGLTNFSQVKVVVDDNSNVAGVRSQAESLGFETQSPIDTIEQINEVFGYFNVVLGGFGLIGMIVAVLGMFNTLTISLLERTKEIGLMIALGARNRDMKRLFILEALLLSFTGALIGIIGSIANGFIINFVMNVYAKNRGVTESFAVFSNPLWLIIGLTLFMCLVGLAVSFVPARRAEHISPIEALRRE